jgi:Arc/MetJ-type ribon-helix-helix transcriptional regulator
MRFCHTRGMVAQKVAVTVDARTLREIDRQVAAGRFPNRSRAVQRALELLIEREGRTRLLHELAKLDPAEEQALADEQLTAETAWPAY